MRAAENTGGGIIRRADAAIRVRFDTESVWIKTRPGMPPNVYGNVGAH